MINLSMLETARARASVCASTFRFVFLALNDHHYAIFLVFIKLYMYKNMYVEVLEQSDNCNRDISCLKDSNVAKAFF